MGNWLKVTVFRGLRHCSALGEAGFGRRRKLHGAHGMGNALLLCAELILVLRQLAVKGYSLSSKKRQVFRATVPFGGKGESIYNNAVFPQRSAIPLKLHTWLQEIHFWGHEEPGVTSGRHGNGNRCVTQTLWHTNSAILFKWILPCSQLNCYCDYHQLQWKSDASLHIWWLFTHQNVVSLDNTRLYAFFPLLGRKLPKPSLFESKISHAPQETPFPQTSKIRL